MRAVEGLSVLVTGGGSGIGEGVARNLCRSGARVTISGRRRDKIEAVAKALGPNCRAVVGDVARTEDRKHMIEEAVAHGGGLNALVNNAGNMYRAPITEAREDEILALFQTNVVAAMMLTGLAVPHLEKRGGAVIFLGSVHTLRAYPGRGTGAVTEGANGTGRATPVPGTPNAARPQIRSRR